MNATERELFSNDPPLSGLAADPLRDRTQAQHRNVLIVSSLAILIAQLNLAPTKISALGVELQSHDRNVIRWALLAAVIYFFAAFLLSGVADYVLWLQRRQEASKMRRQLKEAREEAERTERDHWPQQSALDPDKQTSAWNDHENRVQNIESWKDRERGYARLTPINYLRACLDFGLPIALAAAAIIELAIRLT